MKRFVFLVFAVFSTAFVAFGQSGTTTVNNTITIQGNVYYFKPATTPSSPQPKVGASDFIGTGSWYGEDAAKAWASIADWAIEHCLQADSPVKVANGVMIYISSVHAYRGNSKESDKYATGCARPYHASVDGITIYYWIVGRGEQMEDGHRATRSFRF